MHIRISIFLIFLFSGLLRSQQEWNKALDKDGIIIHTRKVVGSTFLEFLAETRMAGTIAGFKKTFTDVSNYADWMPDCKSVYLVGPNTSTEFTYYMEIKVPFPIANRYTIQNVRFSEKPGELTVNLANCEDCQSVETGSVRIKSAYGSWVVRQENEKEISIRFQYFADPGGNIPAWLVNSFIVKSPHKTLVNLRELLDSN